MIFSSSGIVSDRNEERKKQETVSTVLFEKRKRRVLHKPDACVFLCANFCCGRRHLAAPAFTIRRFRAGFDKKRFITVSNPFITKILSRFDKCINLQDVLSVNRSGDRRPDNKKGRAAEKTRAAENKYLSVNRPAAPGRFGFRKPIVVKIQGEENKNDEQL